MIPKLKEYLKNEYEILKNTVYPLEYAAWWLVRICMVGMIIYNRSKDRESIIILIMCANLLATFTIPLFRLLFFKKIFFGNLPFRIQSVVDMFIFAGSFLGHGLDFNGTVAHYDKYLHMASGALVVFIGYLILMSLKTSEKLTPILKTAGSFGFSCVVMLVWEVFEFICDVLIEGSDNQNLFFYAADNDFIFFRIFGYGAGKVTQYPVLDTNFDILTATVSAVVCAAVLYTVLKVKEGKKPGEVLSKNN